jgi:hypothetical protein
MNNEDGSDKGSGVCGNKRTREEVDDVKSPSLRAESPVEMLQTDLEDVLEMLRSHTAKAAKVDEAVLMSCIDEHIDPRAAEVMRIYAKEITEKIFFASEHSGEQAEKVLSQAFEVTVQFLEVCRDKGLIFSSLCLYRTPEKSPESVSCDEDAHPCHGFLLPPSAL